MEKFPDKRQTYHIADLTDEEEILLRVTPGWNSYFFCESLGQETDYPCDNCYYCPTQDITFKYRKPR